MSRTVGSCFTAEENLKYNKYEAGYASYLRAKFFSDKDIYGGDIFDLEVTIGNETIRASRRPPTQSYADPAQSFVDSGDVLASGVEKPSASGTERSPNIPNGSVAPTNKSD
ncbi:ABC transporter B family member 20 [Bienertia sinuspersici]